MHSLQEKSMTQCSVFKNKWFFLLGRPMPKVVGSLWLRFT